MDMIAVTFFFFGTIIGSFLNVVILRYNTGVSLQGRSKCFSCGKELRWYELMPVLSYLILRGSCRSCKSVISAQYPLVELLTGLLFWGVYIKGHNDLSAIYPLTIISLLVIILVYDLRHKIIPNGIVYAFITLSFANLFVDMSEMVFQTPTMLDALAGPILALPFALIWLFSKGRWMGLGDAKLIVGIGWALGFVYGLSAVILAFWIGAAVSLMILGTQKIPIHKLILPKFLFKHSFSKSLLSIKSEIPFAPFLIIGFLLVFFFNITVFQVW